MTRTRASLRRLLSVFALLVGVGVTLFSRGRVVLATWVGVLLLLRLLNPAAFWYFVSFTLSALNPRVIAQSLAQLGGEALVWLRLRGRAPAPETFKQRASYTLPFSGRWQVAQGGITWRTSHSWHLLGQRYAYDFVAIDGQDKRHRGDGRLKEDYFAYGQPIIAPADGTIIGVRDGVRDGPTVGTGWIDWRTTDFRGNFVTIRHVDGEYSLLAHLIPGSIVVRVGDAVRRGELIARCGHSGHSTEPHLHFQLQDHGNFFLTAALPVSFANVVLDGVKRDGSVRLTRGNVVEPARFLKDEQPSEGPGSGGRLTSA